MTSDQKWGFEIGSRTKSLGRITHSIPVRERQRTLRPIQAISIIPLNIGLRVDEFGREY